MLDKNYDLLKIRWNEFWNRENHDRPLMSIYAPRDNVSLKSISKPENFREMWLDTEYQLAFARQYMESTKYIGEAFPVFNPNLGPDLLGAICGCELEFGADTSWAVPNVSDWDTHPEIRFDRNNFWWKKICEITSAAVEDSKGDYLVGITDLHPGADGLASMRGPQELAMDLFDNPEQIKSRIFEVADVHRQVFDGLTEIISGKQEGSVNWMGIWNPERPWYVTCCDFSCLISCENYEEFIIPELEYELDILPASIYHLDGPGALRHLDRILELKRLKGVQWVYGAGQPSAKHWIPVLKKIQDAGKCLQVYCEPDDIKEVCEALNPEGVHLICYSGSESEGVNLLKAAEDIYRNKA